MARPVGRIDEIVVDCRDPMVLGSFWAAVLGVAPTVREPAWVTVRDPEQGLVLAFQAVPEAKTAKNRLHLDVAVVGADKPAHHHGTGVGHGVGASAGGPAGMAQSDGCAVERRQVSSVPHPGEWCWRLDHRAAVQLDVALADGAPGRAGRPVVASRHQGVAAGVAPPLFGGAPQGDERLRGWRASTARTTPKIPHITSFPSRLCR